MKKFFVIVCCLCLCAAMSVSVFAAKIDSEYSASIYATKAQVSELLEKMEAEGAAAQLDGFDVSLDERTIMPLYRAALSDLAASGVLACEPYTVEGKQIYMADVVDASGKFAGIVEFTTDDIRIYMPTDEENRSIDFKNHTAQQNTLKKGNFQASDAKLMFVDGLGYVYFLSDGTHTTFISTGFKGENSEIFTVENNGVVSLDDRLTEYAKQLTVRSEELTAALAALAPGENLATGAAQISAPAAGNQSKQSSSPLLWVSGVLCTAGIVSMIGYILLTKKQKENV